MEKHTRSAHVFTAVMSLAVLLPLAIVSARGSTFDLQQSRDRALDNKATLSAQRQSLTRLNARCGSESMDTKDLSCRAYLMVQKECLQRQSIRQQTGCPGINDMNRITDVLRTLESGVSDPALGAAPAQKSSVPLAVINLKSLPPSDRLALRHTMQIGYCSEKLPQALYVLCSTTVGDNKKSAPMGLTNDIAKIQADRLKKQAEKLGK